MEILERGEYTWHFFERKITISDYVKDSARFWKRFPWKGNTDYKHLQENVRPSCWSWRKRTDNNCGFSSQHFWLKLLLSWCWYEVQMKISSNNGWVLTQPFCKFCNAILQKCDDNASHRSISREIVCSWAVSQCTFSTISHFGFGASVSRMPPKGSLMKWLKGVRKRKAEGNSSLWSRGKGGGIKCPLCFSLKFSRPFGLL